MILTAIGVYSVNTKDAEDRRAVYRKVIEAVGKEYPGYEMQVAMDTDFSKD